MLPLGNGKLPTVILSHGFNGGYSDFEKECIYLAAHGCNAYAFDFQGGSNHSSSGGSSTDMTVFTEKDDLLTVFDSIRNLDRVDKDNIFLLGASQGGLVTALAAEERVGFIKGLILYYPALNIPNDWRVRYPNPHTVPDTIDFWGVKLGKNYVTLIHDFDPFGKIGGFKKTVIIFQGNCDNIVPLTVAEKCKSLYDNSDLIVYENEGHGFSEEVNRKCMERAIEFIYE
ncbi:MAG: alpha/beta hydrolase [Oscillospiraceae bacterium]|nr:alpha/beta hydrolase [Oscillospiraceae bacterium]